MNALLAPELPGIAVPVETLRKTESIGKLLQKATSIKVVQEFLRSKDIPYSAPNWEELLDKRIVHAISTHKLSLADFASLLSEVEEHQRSHIFLYTAPKPVINRLIDPSTVEKTADRLNLKAAITDIIVEELPASPTITTIRQEPDGWTFKIISKRVLRELSDQREDGDRLIKEWTKVDSRVVNVVRVHKSGLVQVRIQSQKTSNDYDSELTQIWNKLKDFLPVSEFKEESLHPAKLYLWENRDSLKTSIRYSDSTMTNGRGTTISATTGAVESDLFSDRVASGCLDHFLKSGGARCDSSNLWFKAQAGLLSREVHVLLKGRPNEFAISGNCTRLEYEFVLNELRSHNK